jgi:hypothetical protein
VQLPRTGKLASARRLLSEEWGHLSSQHSCNGSTPQRTCPDIPPRWQMR